MKTNLKRYVSFFAVSAALALMIGCSGAASTAADSTSGALGLPKAEMKCNGQSCIN
ncbi:hypothetical protein BH10BDE1_BH10BDE1_05010 [soil metagenome]